MCFHDLSQHGVSRATALKTMAAVGGWPLIGSITPLAVNAEPVNHGAPVTAFIGTTALVGDTLTAVPDATIVITGNRITAVGPSAAVSVPSGAKRIPLKGKYVIPGLIDSHVHFFQSGGLFTRPDAIDLRAVRPYTEELAWIDANLNDTFMRYLRAGITSVSDVGGPFWNYDVRARAAQTALAPRVAAAGPLISSIDRSILSPHDDPPIVRIDSPDVARELVMREAARQTDFVKFWWVVTKDHPAAGFVPVAKAGMEQSKAMNLRVAVHALELETATLAAETGTDVLVHSVFDVDVDDRFVGLLKERNIILCPTLRVLGGYQTTFAERPALSIRDLRLANPDTVATLFMLADIPGAETSEQRTARAKADPAQARAAAMRNLKRLHDAGVVIAAGTDAGNIGTLHASSLYAELHTMVESGLSPKEVLITATLNGAKHMAQEQHVGTIAEGKVADLLVLDADPIADIHNVAAVDLVVKNGSVYTPGDLTNESPMQLAQRHANAINAHNAQALSEVYAPNAHVNDRGKPVSSQSGVASYYGDYLAKNPDVHVKVTSRTAHGGTVVFREELSSLAGGATENTETTFTISANTITSTVIRPLSS
jgi:imidazolonepropionase-like amidohydrolase